jgi:hypothetical protein
MSGRALETSLGADNCFGILVEHHHDIKPAEVSDQDFGHVDAPPFVGLGGFGFPSNGRPLRSQALIWRCPGDDVPAAAADSAAC